MFVFAVVLTIVLPIRHWMGWLVPHSSDGRAQDVEVILKRAGNPDVHLSVDVIRTIDGDTFLARIHQREERDIVLRVRLRGIDAPELKASCREELEKAQAATDALRDLLGQGNVTIYNIGPDKYEGRVVADVATRRTANVAAAMLVGGYARTYHGGHREGWCSRGWRFWQ
jgi:endonuclease YncB( thermonuclease family)